MTEVTLFANLPEQLRLDIEAGGERCLCPRCDGGQSRERSLSVRQDGIGVLKLKCFRASCGWYGISVTDPNAKLQRKNIKPPSVYRDPTIPLQGVPLQLLRSAYGLSKQAMFHHGWRLAEAGHALVMPILDPNGMELGHVTRTFDTPKRVYTFKASARPWLDWWLGEVDRYAPIVIVEDCLSACRLYGNGYNAVALLGTGLTVDQAKQIRDVAKGRRVYLALDRDAFEKAIHMTHRHAHVLKMLPVCLDEDVKNVAYDHDIDRMFPHG